MADVTGSVNYALTSRQLVKDLLGLSDTSQDALIDELINAASDFIENYCGGRRFLATDYVEVYDSNNSNKVFLRQRPCNAISLVNYRAGVPSNPTWIAYNANGYLTYLKEGYVAFFARFVPVPQAFQITYNAGFLIDWTNYNDRTLHTLPYDLTQCTNELIALWYNRRNAAGIAREQTEGQMIVYFETNDISTLQKTILNKYKQYNIAH